VRTWPAPGRITIAAGPTPVSQWAQDNGKSGEVSGEPVTLIARYASRAEESSVLVPGDTFVAESLQSAGLRVAQSPLLVQGGNLYAASGPASGERVLLIGEAEVCRNVSLGLARDQVIEAFRVEFGVDRCVVLPAVSFHIDFELTIRAHEGRLLAFVNDSAWGA